MNGQIMRSVLNCVSDAQKIDLYALVDLYDDLWKKYCSRSLRTMTKAT